MITKNNFGSESINNQFFSERNKNQLNFKKYLQVFYTLNEENASKVLSDIMNKFDGENFESLLNQNIIQKHQLVKDTCVDDLIGLLQNELQVESKEILNVAWGFLQQGIRSRYNLTFITEEQVNHFHINQQKFSEWKRKPENQLFKPFFKINIQLSQTSSEFQQNKFQNNYANNIQTQQIIRFTSYYQKDLSFQQCPKFSSNIKQQYPFTSNTQFQNPQKTYTRFQSCYTKPTTFEPKILNTHQKQNVELPTQKEITNQEVSQKLNIEKEQRKANLESIAQKCVLLKTIQGKNVTLEIRKYPNHSKTDFENITDTKKIMIIGETGVGKSTLINFFCNYYNGVEFDFPFRFYLVDETDESIFSESDAVSKTSEVISYYLKGNNGKHNLQIIDTPGFGDTRGKDIDLINSQRIADFLRESDSLNLICFVMKSSQNRLTSEQIYIMNGLLQVFGNNVQEHFMFLFTFSDFEVPQALQVLFYEGNQDQHESPFANIRPQLKVPYWLKFNNLAFKSVETKEQIKTLWQDSYHQFQVFYEEKICKSEIIDLTITKKVLEERNQIKIIYENLKQEISTQINMENLIQTCPNENEIPNIEQLTNLIKNLLVSVNNLNRIALQPLKRDFKKECLDNLINDEYKQKKDGYEKRIIQLKKIQKIWESIALQIN